MRLNLKICQPLSVNAYSGGKNLVTAWAVCTLILASCDAGKKLYVKKISNTFISNLVFQINFQAVFLYDCAKNLMRNVEN